MKGGIMPKKESYYVRMTREHLRGVKPVEFALDGPSVVKQVTVQSIHSTHTIRFRFIKYDKKINAVKFNFTYDLVGPILKGTHTTRVWTLGSNSFPIDQYIDVRAIINKKKKLFQLVFTPNPNA